MRNSVLTIMKKEFARLFGDKRMIFTTILLPGLIIYIMYSFMGEGFSNMYNMDDKVFTVDVVNMPAIMEAAKNVDQLEFTDINANEIDKAKEDLENEEVNLVVVYPENFDQDMMAYDASTSTEPAPNVEVYYSSAIAESETAYRMFTEISDQMESSLANKFDINAGDKQYDIATNEDQLIQAFANLLPMLIIIFLYSGCLGIASESIAGEKERGTIATLLVTPMKRSGLALGKMLSLSIMGIMSGVSSFIGIMLSLPKLMGDMDASGLGSVYQPVDYVLLLLVILTVTLLFVGLISIISALSKSVKEATTAMTPLMILIIIVALAPLMLGGTLKEFYWYLIPVFNNVLCLSGIFSLDYSITNIMVTVVSDLIYAGVLVAVLSKIFNSERIMYTQ